MATTGGTDFHIVPNFPLKPHPVQRNQNAGRLRSFERPPHFHCHLIALRIPQGNKWAETEHGPPKSNNRRDRLPNRTSLPPQTPPCPQKPERGKITVFRTPPAFPPPPDCLTNTTREQVGRDGARPSKIKQSEGPTSTSSLTSPSHPTLSKETRTREDYGFSNAPAFPLPPDCLTHTTREKVGRD